MVNDLYRGARSADRVGDGHTADAALFERASGDLVKDKNHIKKANIYIRGLRNWLRRNPDAAPSDRAIAINEMNRLLHAVGRRTEP